MVLAGVGGIAESPCEALIGSRVHEFQKMLLPCTLNT
jgi:hypothetical protein